ncbi:MAG: response regulator [Chrysiogenales bacterium]|nr:MAG: response regulator [Chrysiogenales bacterium]
MGYRVSATISSGEEAVRRVREILPDLIIMDIFLANDMDGIQASSLIAKEIDVPVIFLTANADSTTIKRADEIRHYGYLIKPIKQNELSSIISTALQRHQIEINNRDTSTH